MQKVEFWLNNQQFNEAIEKLGVKKELYGFAKNSFLKALEEVKELKKEVGFECPSCHAEYYREVKARISKTTGGLIPFCPKCYSNLIRRVKKIAEPVRLS